MEPQSKSGLHKALTVGEVAARSGVAVSTLHFYESAGLIRSWRNQGNQRRYAREVLRRVAVIRVAQRAGISLAAIRDALRTLPDERTPTGADWTKLSAAWRADLNDRGQRASFAQGQNVSRGMHGTEHRKSQCK